MQPKTVIKVENLSKLYRLGELHKQTGSFRDRVTQAVTRLAQSAKRKAATPMRSAPNAMPSFNDDYIWALKDVSFEVKQGEVLGIIGCNGAGKTTLLKILSRITKPTKGKAWINGRVGSLLEVGTGFHSELTGRENIYLNGAILGMKKAEIDRKFDEIVDFAGIEKFLNTPVKHYSSGMYVRLAFAVAAHLEPEILLVDEVLAVGDVEFQRKCIGRMRQVAEEGRTVLFVSHNMGAISRLSSIGILLEKGQVIFRGSVQQTIEEYYGSFAEKGSHQFLPRGRTGWAKSRITNVSLHHMAGTPITEVAFGDPFIVRISYETSRAEGVLGGFAIRTPDGISVLGTNCNDIDPMSLRGQGTIECIVTPNYLAPGTYYLQCALFLDAHTYEMDDRIERALDFDVVMYTGKGEGLSNPRETLTLAPFKWRHV